MKNNQAINIHKQQAMGDTKMAKGGKVPSMPLNPVTEAKRENGVPGMKKGGKAKKK